MTVAGRRRGIGVHVLVALGVLVALVAAGPGAEPAGAATTRTYGGQPLDDVLAAAGQHARPDCGLGRDQLAAMMLAPTFSETGTPPDRAPSPMTLSRWDTQPALWAFGNPSTPYQRAFWHPGIGLWQFDSAGYWDLTAATAISTETAARQAAQVMSSRYCASTSTSVEAKMRYAWSPWYGCASGSVNCVYQDLSGGGPLRNVLRDNAVSRFGGMEQRSCRVSGIGDVTCYFVDPARAQGYAGFASPTGPPTPITSPFYVFEAGGREYRYWLRQDSGYDASVVASKPVRADARTSLTWTTIEGSGGALCDATTGKGACTPFGLFDIASAGPGKIRVSGWAIDPDSSSPTDVHVYVGAVGTALRADGDRPDVAAALPRYGSRHGFSAALPTAPGTYDVCAYAIDLHPPTVGNALLGCRRVTVPTGSPFGTLDAVTTDGPGRVRLTGWAVDPDTDAAVDIHVYLDGRGAANVPATVPRADVGKALPLWGSAHGFDISIGSVTAGRHQVCAYAIDRVAPGSARDLGCRSVTMPSGAPVGFLDAVVPGQASIRVAGWALDPDTAEPIDVHVYVDGAPRLAVVADRNRVDVAKAYRGWGAAHGFSTDLRPMGSGPHEVCVFAIDSAGGPNPLLGCRTVEVSGDPFGVLESVRPGPVSVKVTGWAIDPDVDGPVDVHVYVDGVGRANVRADAHRADVGTAFGGLGPGLGLSTVIGGIPAGTHEVCAYAINVGRGATQLLGCRQATVVGGSPFGFVDLVAKSGTSLRVAGWALDPDTPGPVDVHVYVDGVGTSITANRPRADIAAAFPTYGADHGFDRTLTVPAGARQACLHLYDVGAGENAFLGCYAL